MIKNSPAVQQFFNSNPTAKELHFTCNGSAFVSRNYAQLHASDLVKNKKGTATVITITREEAFAEGAPVDTTDELRDAAAAAQSVYNLALKTKEAVYADPASKGTDKTNAANALNRAEKALNKANEAYNAARGK